MKEPSGEAEAGGGLAGFPCLGIAGMPSVSAPGTHAALGLCLWPNLLRCTPKKPWACHGPLPGRGGLEGSGAVFATVCLMLVLWRVCWVTFNCRWTPVPSADDGTADLLYKDNFVYFGGAGCSLRWAFL